MTTELRTSFRFNAREAAFAALLKNPSTDEAVAVRELTGVESLTHATAGQLVHTLIEAGMSVIKDRAEEVRTARLAEFLKNDPEHHAWRSSRQRRTQRRLSKDAA